MSNELNEVQLLKEIDSRQDDILQDLDDLNDRVETILEQWTRPKEQHETEEEAS